MLASLRTALGCAALAVAALAAGSARADGPVTILVLKEHGVGSAAQAQPYVDKFVSLAATHNGWPSAKGHYHTTRASAETFVQQQKPRYGILSLAAFLAFQQKHSLDIVGQVAASRAGGQQYHIVSKTAGDLAACKGKRLASDHVDDPKFIEQVVAGGTWKLADFTVVTTTRPLQTIRKVITGDAECALIDDAQLAEVAHIDGAAGIRSIWKSDKLPPMVVAAFPSAPADERKTFQQNLAKICEGEGQKTCAEVGIQALRAATKSDYAAVLAAYAK